MTKNLQKDYNAHRAINPYAFVQQTLDLPVTLDLNTLIDERDPARTVIMAVEESGIHRYVRTQGRDSHGYRSIDMLKAVILSKTLLGYAGLREMEDIARNDIRFRLIFKDGETPSHQSFHRFIVNNLSVSVETVMSELNRYMATKLPEDIDTDTEVIDGTKEEADASKMSFVWRGSSEKYQGRLYRKIYELLIEIITFFNSDGHDHQLSILRHFDLCYMAEVCRELEKYREKK
jgi:transposase